MAPIAILVLCPCPDEAWIMIEIRMNTDGRDSTLYKGFHSIQLCRSYANVSIPTPYFYVCPAYVKDRKRQYYPQFSDLNGRNIEKYKIGS